MKIRLGDLRRVIRHVVLCEYGQATAASGVDPTDHKGFYPYDIERGTDIYGYWYRSPGREIGTEGDPFRPDDAAAYIGLKPPAGEDSEELDMI